MIIFAAALLATATPEAEIEAALDAAADVAAPHAVLLHVRGGELSRPFEDARGAEPGASFRTASVTKSFTAAAALRLAEQGRLDLAWFPAGAVAPLYADGYEVREMSLQRLLRHTAGLADHAQTEAYFQAILADPDHVWTAEEQIAFAAEHADKVAEPDEVFSYSDTGYVLVGETIEQLTGEDLAAAVRRLVDFEGLGLDGTYWEGREPAPAGETRLTQTYQGMDISGIHPSMDTHGGGGLVSTTRDLAVYFDALTAGRVVESEGLLARMMRPTEQSLASSMGGYGMGLMVHEIGGETCYGHGGFWGVLAWGCPESGVSAAGAVSDQAGYGALEALLMEAIEAAQGAPSDSPAALD